jgi:BirA family transcriptional regulator, biotin operon repressor / biotin---[acetyl-CoA-carboxylase] ligase
MAMDQLTLEKKLSDLPLGPIRYFQTIGSTNDEAARWADEGAPDFSVVLADEQTQGRGRGARKWHTYPGTALAFTVILRPTPTEIHAGASTPRFTGLGAIGVCKTLCQQFDLPAQIKWPNDVLLQRKKCCGVLAESHWLGDQLTAVILGIGINIAPQAVPSVDQLQFPATSVEGELGQTVNRFDLLHMILAQIMAWRHKLLSSEFMQTWEAALAFRDKWVRLTTTHPDGHAAPAIFGHILGLNTDGSLSFKTHDGQITRIQSGELSSTDRPIHLRPVDTTPK